MKLQCGMLANACNHCTLVAEARGTNLQGKLGLCNTVEDSNLRCMHSETLTLPQTNEKRKKREVMGWEQVFENHVSVKD